MALSLASTAGCLKSLAATSVPTLSLEVAQAAAVMAAKGARRGPTRWSGTRSTSKPVASRRLALSAHALPDSACRTTAANLNRRIPSP
ncbi:hypothetical protein GCM10018965_099180 [Nonomuraea roseola]